MKATGLLVTLCYAVLLSEGAPSGNSINSILPSIDCPEAKVAVQLAHAYIALYRKVTKIDVKLDTVKNIGYDIYKDEDVKRLICKIINVKSVKELGQVLNTPYSFIKMRYKRTMNHVVREGGVRGIALKVNIGQDITNAAKRHGFPNFPLKHSDDLVPFFRTSVIRYGQDFLTTLAPRMNVTVQDPDYVGRVFAKARSLKEVKTGLGLDDNSAGNLFDTIKAIIESFEFHGSMMSHSLKLMQMLESRGLLILD